MEKISIFKAINSVESNLSTIFTKQDVVNLLNTIDVDQTIQNSDGMYWKKSSDEWQKMYEDEAERRQETIAYNDSLVERINDLKIRLWNRVTGYIDVYDNEENYDDISFTSNITKEIFKNRDSFISEIEDKYKSEIESLNKRIS